MKKTCTIQLSGYLSGYLSGGEMWGEAEEAKLDRHCRADSSRLEQSR